MNGVGMTQSVNAPDGDLRTLHVRCGSDIRNALRQAGFSGDFLEFADPYCQGPVRNSGNLIELRAGFLAACTGRPQEVLAGRLRRELSGLRKAGRFERVVLWFEHDSHDQLILARILAELADLPAHVDLSLICIDSFPGIARFLGLGQLGPAQLRGLWPHRQPVTAEQIDLGCAVWAALQEPSPLGLHALAKRGTPELPQMAGALLRHLQELPWTVDGLSLTQRLALQALAGGSRSGAAIFRELHNRTEPLPFLGDQMFWHLLADMQCAARPPFAAAVKQPDSDRGIAWPRRILGLTASGRALLDGGTDWLRCGPPDRWVGGVLIQGTMAGGPARQWRWCPDEARPTLSGAGGPAPGT